MSFVCFAPVHVIFHLDIFSHNKFFVSSSRLAAGDDGFVRLEIREDTTAIHCWLNFCEKY